jgi:TRAP-type mannitol/chloroaromatic compound transport system permease small subunit
MESVARVLDRFIDIAGRIASWASLALVLLMAANVLLRYLFHKGSVWAGELEWHLMSPIVLIGMSYALLHDGHLRVDVAYVHFPPRLQRTIDLVAALLGIAFAAIVVWLSWKYVLQSWSIGEGSPDPGGLPARWALKAMIPIGFALLLVYAVAETIHAAARLARTR